jgi:colanic acid/amylovoran biosynthesis glycosyltransferase
VRDGESGFLVEPRNTEALASAVVWLADRPNLWERMGRAGRTHVEKCFNSEILNDQLISIYRSTKRRSESPFRRESLITNR